MVAPAKTAPKRPRPKYQVFISSTSEDLRDERAAVTWEILKARYIPAGMESFTAMDDRGWETIKRTIDLSDYYVVVVAGRYGSIDPTTGISWTHREYWYARDKGMRVLAFIRNDTKITKPNMDADQTRLEAFKTELRNAHLYDRWDDASDLAGKVAAAVRHQNEVDEDDGKLPLGWYRGDDVPSGAALEEFARLSAENAELKAKLSGFEGAKEKLVLAHIDGTPIGDEVSWETEKIVFESARLQEPAFYPRGITEPDDAELKEYAKTLTLTGWVRLAVMNVGDEPAQDVVADFVAHLADGVEVGEFDAPGTPHIRRPWYLDPAAHVYVDSHYIEEHGAIVRQRARLIAVGGSERLIEMGFRAVRDVRDKVDLPIVIDYTIRSRDGAVATGSFTLLVQVRGGRKVDEKDLLELHA
jgi:hypothetical protein